MKHLALLLTIFLIFSCSTYNSELEQLRDQAIYFDVPVTKDQISDKMVNRLSDAKIIVVGETHYVQEHQEFFSLLLERLYENNVRIFTTESNHSEGVIFNLYVSGADIELTDMEKGMDSYWMDSLRAFNQKLKRENKPLLQMQTFDMNHWPEVFSRSMKIYGQHISDNADLLKLVEKISKTNIASREYADAIRELSAGAESNRYQLTESENNTIIEMCQIEIRSMVLRNSFDNQKREEIIIENIENSIAQLKDDEKIVINCGMWHAQKTSIWDIGVEQWLGEYLQGAYDSHELFHLAVFAVKGEKKAKFYSKERSYYNLLEADSPPNISKELAVIADGRISFLDMTTIDWRKKITFDYGYKTRLVKMIPGNHYDGLLMYPAQSVLESSLLFER